MQLILDEKQRDPKNAAILLCENHLEFLKAFLWENDSDFKKLKENSSVRLDLLEKEDENSPWFLNAKAEIIFERAAVRAKYGELVSAAFDLRKAYKLFETNHEKFPATKITLKGLGILHAIIGSIPENYQWIAKAAGLNGTITQGLSELNEALKESMSNPSEKNQILLLLIYFETHLDKNISKAYGYLKLYDRDYISQLISFSFANVYSTDGKNDLMIETLLRRKHDNESYSLNYLDYMLGMGKLNRLDSNASDHFKMYVSNYKGNSFIKAGWQKLAWCDLLFNKGNNYNSYMNKVKTNGNVFTDEDRQAQKEAESGVKPNVTLLKSRLLFDGGYFLKSLEQIVNKRKSEFPTQRDTIEFIYRVARNFDMLNQPDKAITFYQNTITLGDKTEYYFAANAALSLGMLYEKQNDKQNAIIYYKKCLSMRHHEYQNSIDQKAKAGLNRLKSD